MDKFDIACAIVSPITVGQHLVDLVGRGDALSSSRTLGPRHRGGPVRCGVRQPQHRDRLQRWPYRATCRQGSSTKSRNVARMPNAVIAQRCHILRRLGVISARPRSSGRQTQAGLRKGPHVGPMPTCGPSRLAVTVTATRPRASQDELPGGPSSPSKEPVLGSWNAVAKSVA